MASSLSTAFVPPPLAARRLPGSAAAAAAKAPPIPGGSSFTPGHGAGVTTHTAAAVHPSRPRMSDTPASPSSSGWAAAALRAAGGVDPATHHVAEVLRRAGAHATPAEEPLTAPAYGSLAMRSASVVDVAPSAAVRAWVAAQSAPAAVATPAATVMAVSAPTGGEWARRQASLSRHVAARWAASTSPPESTPLPVPDLNPVAATPLRATGGPAAVTRAQVGSSTPSNKSPLDAAAPSPMAGLSPPSGDSPFEAAAAGLTPSPTEPPPVEASAEASPPPPPPGNLINLLSPPLAASPLTSAAAVLGATADGAASLRAAMDSPTDVKSLLYPATPASPVEDAASRLGSSESYTAPPPPAPPSDSPPVEEKPKTLGEYLDTPVGSSPLESAAAVLARSARLAPSGKAAMEEPPRLAALLDAPPSPESPLEAMAAMLAPPEPEAPPAEPEYPPEAYVDWDRAPPPAATPLEASASMLERSARLDPSGKAAMEIAPPLAELLDAPPLKESPLQEMARRIADGRAGHVAGSAAVADGDEDSEEAEEMAEGADEAASEPSASNEAAVDPSAALLMPPPGDSPLEAAAAVLARSARLAPTGKAAMEVPPPLATLLCPPTAASPLTESAIRLAIHDKVKVVEAAPRRFDVSTTTRSPVPAPLSSPEEVKELLTAQPARSPLTMAADGLASPSPVGVSTSELEGSARLAAAREARAKPSTGAPVVSAAPPPLPSFLTAALTGTAEPAAADAVKDQPVPIRDGWRAAVPPAVTLAFVGACLALSQAAGAVMDSGVPLH